MPETRTVDVADEIESLAKSAKQKDVVISAYEAEILMRGVQEIRRLRTQPSGSTSTRTVPIDSDGVENRFPSRENPIDVYNRERCQICGVRWEDPEPREVVNPEDSDGPKLLVRDDHATLSPNCDGRRPVPTLFDNRPVHKGAYSA